MKPESRSKVHGCVPCAGTSSVATVGTGSTLIGVQGTKAFCPTNASGRPSATFTAGREQLVLEALTVADLAQPVGLKSFGSQTCGSREPVPAAPRAGWEQVLIPRPAEQDVWEASDGPGISARLAREVRWRPKKQAC